MRAPEPHYVTKHLACFCCYSYIKGLLGGPTPAEHEALKQEKEDLKQQLATTKQQLEDLQANVGRPCCFASCDLSSINLQTDKNLVFSRCSTIAWQQDCANLAQVRHYVTCKQVASSLSEMCQLCKICADFKFMLMQTSTSENVGASSEPTAAA